MYMSFPPMPPGYDSTSTVVTVTASALGTLTISPSGTAVNGEQRVNITARTSGGAIPAGAVPVTLSGSGFTTTRATVSDWYRQHKRYATDHGSNLYADCPLPRDIIQLRLD